MDAKRCDDEARRLRATNKAQVDPAKKGRTRDRANRAMPAPEANAELQTNLDRRRLITHLNAKSKSEKFPPPHQDGALGYPLGNSEHIEPSLILPDIPYSELQPQLADLGGKRSLQVMPETSPCQRAPESE